MTTTAPYCNARCSRPANPEEFREDYRKRVAAIERAELEGTHSRRQIQDARDALLTFTGYLRCTKPAAGR